MAGEYTEPQLATRYEVVMPETRTTHHALGPTQLEEAQRAARDAGATLAIVEQAYVASLPEYNAFKAS